MIPAQRCKKRYSVYLNEDNISSDSGIDEEKDETDFDYDVERKKGKIELDSCYRGPNMASNLIIIYRNSLPVQAVAQNGFQDKGGQRPDFNMDHWNEYGQRRQKRRSDDRRYRIK